MSGPRPSIGPAVAWESEVHGECRARIAELERNLELARQREVALARKLAELSESYRQAVAEHDEQCRINGELADKLAESEADAAAVRAWLERHTIGCEKTPGTLALEMNCEQFLALESGRALLAAARQAAGALRSVASLPDSSSPAQLDAARGAAKDALAALDRST